MKKPLRLLLLLAGGFALLVAVLIGLAFTPAVQTWAVRRAVAGLPGTKIELGRISIGMNSVHVENLRISQPGLLLAVPSADLELPVIAAARGRVMMAKLIAKDWTIDLTPAGVPPGALAGPGAPGPSPAVVMAASATGVVRPPASVFDGLFKSLQLPVDFSLDDAELEGDVTRPDGRVHLVVTGGKLGVGRDASFTVTAGLASAGVAAAPVSALTVRGTLTAHMDTPRSFSMLTFVADTTAAGPKLSSGTAVHISLDATRDLQGENYQLALTVGGRELTRLVLALPTAAGAPLTGSWAFDANDTDVAPFALGHALPAFKTTGKGTFSASRDFKEITTLGGLAGAVEIEPVAAGASLVLTDFSTDFDVVEHGDVTRVTRLKVILGGASVEALQGFEFNAVTRELKVADPAADLLQVALADVPLSLVRTFLPPGVIINGGSLSALLRVGARNGGFAVRSAKPLVIDHLSLTQTGGWTLEDTTVAFTPAADYTPQGWQLEVTEGALQSHDADLMTFSAHAGQLVGAHEPFKATGQFSSNLPALATQPSGRAFAAFTHGTASGDLTVVLGDKQGIEFKFSLKDATAADQTAMADVAFDARADLAVDGSIALNMPVSVVKEGRTSAFTLGGTIGTVKAGVQMIDLQLTGETLNIADLAPLAGLGASPAVPPPAVATSTVPTVPAPAAASIPAGPPWAGIAGKVKFSFKQVVFSPKWQSSLDGAVKLDPAAATFSTSGTLGADAPFTATGSLAYAAGGTPAYVLKADVKLNNFDTAPLLRTIEGRADFHATLTSQATTPNGLGDRLQGKVDVISKGGVCRLLAVTDDNSGILQSAAGTGATILGSVVGVVAGNKAGGNAATAVTQIAGLLREIRYDQLNLTVSRDAKANIVLDDFNLIAPEVRLAGHGQVRHVEGQPILEQPLTLQLAVAARGSLGSTMAAVGLVGPTPDNLGYRPLVLDLPELGGTLQKPDTDAFYKELAKRAAKTATERITNGVKKGAGALLNGLLGK